MKFQFDLREVEPFFEAIYDTPDDDTPRLVFADWLEEHGEEDYAALIRLQCEYPKLLRLGTTHCGVALQDALVQQSEERQRELIARNEGTWVPATSPPIGAFPGDGQWDRGFIRLSQINLDLERFRKTSSVNFATEVLRFTPWWYGATKLRLDYADVVILTHTNWDAIMKLRCFSHISGVVANHIELSNVVELVNHPIANRLTFLDLRDNAFGEEIVDILMRSPNLGNLETLLIRTGNQISSRGFQTLDQHFAFYVVS